MTDIEDTVIRQLLWSLDDNGSIVVQDTDMAMTIFERNGVTDLVEILFLNTCAVQLAENSRSTAHHERPRPLYCYHGLRRLLEDKYRATPRRINATQDVGLGR